MRDYTTDSIKRCLKYYPRLCEFTTNSNPKCSFNLRYIHNEYKLIGDQYRIVFKVCHPNLGKKMSDVLEGDDAEALFQYARPLISELRTLKLDTSLLVKRVKTDDSIKLPKWFQVALVIGAKIGVKYLCAAIGAKIDLPDFFDGDSGDFDFGDSYDNNYPNLSSLDLSNLGEDYNYSLDPSFYGHHDLMDSYQRDLNQAKGDINHYLKELKRTNITDTYRGNCMSNLKIAMKKAADITDKINKLKT